MNDIAKQTLKVTRKIHDSKTKTKTFFIETTTKHISKR